MLELNITYAVWHKNFSGRNYGGLLLKNILADKALLD